MWYTNIESPSPRSNKIPKTFTFFKDVVESRSNARNAGRNPKNQSVPITRYVMKP